MQDSNGSWRGYACNRFLRLFALASRRLTNTAIWPGGLCRATFFKLVETVQKDARGDELTNL